MMIRKFNHKLIEVSHVLIGIQLPKIWDLEVQLLGPIPKVIGNSKKWNMKMG